MKKTILIVDDNEMFTEFLAEYLGMVYNVRVTNDPGAALACAYEINPDLILVDYNMKGEYNGLDLIRSFKLSSYFYTVPVILVTGESESNLHVDALMKGAADVVRKPFNPKELRVRIEKALSREPELIGA